MKDMVVGGKVESNFDISQITHYKQPGSYRRIEYYVVKNWWRTHTFKYGKILVDFEYILIQKVTRANRSFEKVFLFYTFFFF